jgi:3-hydroxyacyl-CoA dehydrogenase/enoyl-CoA hydratase/3-hydroxybutyryl-CoA epimerase
MSSESKALRSIFFATTEMKKEWNEQSQSTDNVAVLGGGLMGAGIAHVSACKAGARVRVKDISQKGISGALNYS